MPPILPVSEFTNSRAETIHEMLRLLRGANTNKPLCQRLRGPQKGGFLVIASNDDVGKGGDYRDWRLRSFVDDFWFQYHELWQFTSPAQKEVRLYRAYLSIFRKSDQQNLDEFVLIHCDPFDKPDDQDERSLEEKELTCKHKRGPHLHLMKTHDATIPHSHFPLNLGHLDDALSTAEKLTNEIRRAIEVIRHEVLVLSLRKG